MAVTVTSLAKYGALHVLYWGLTRGRVHTYTTHIGLRSERLTCLGTSGCCSFFPHSPLPPLKLSIFSAVKMLNKNILTKVQQTLAITGMSKSTSNIISHDHHLNVNRSNITIKRSTLVVGIGEEEPILPVPINRRQKSVLYILWLGTNGM